MKARRRGYDKFKSIADLVVKIHDRLNDTSSENVLYPVLPKVACLANRNIKVSGTQTAYRVKMCDTFLESLNHEDGQFVFEYDGSIRFDTQAKNNLYGFA